MGLDLLCYPFGNTCQGQAFRGTPCGKETGTCGGAVLPGISASRLLPSSSGQDAALSRLKQGFDSPWERQFFLASAASLEKLSASSSPRSGRGRRQKSRTKLQRAWKN